LRSGEECAGQRVVERMPGLERSVGSDQRMAKQIQVADRVEHLVNSKLVVVTQAFAVQDARLVEHDRVLQAAAERQARGAHRLDIRHESESAGAADFLGIGMLGKVDDDVTVLGSEDGMRKVDREVQLEAMESLEARPLVVHAYLDRLLDAQVAFACRLLLDTRRLQ